jgi:hypothetical protein
MNLIDGHLNVAKHILSNKDFIALCQEIVDYQKVLTEQMKPDKIEQSVKQTGI